MKRIKYTEDDIEFLREYYPKGDWESILNRFPGSTKEKIYNVCHKRGISANYYDRDKEYKKEYYEASIANRKKWTNSEIDILEKKYSLIPVEDVMKLLPGRSYNSIILKANKLFLNSYVRGKQLYSKDDIDFIKNNWKLMSDQEIAQKLNRTSRAIKAMRCELFLFRQDKEKTNYQNLSKFLRGQLHQWKKESMEACNYACILTGSKEFEIHHIISFNTIVRNFIDMSSIVVKENFDDYTQDELSEISELFIEEHKKYSLGVCVEKKLHMLFHQIYGDINDQSQWNDFILRFKEGKLSY